MISPRIMGESEMHVDILIMHLKILNLHKKVLKSYSLLDFEVKSSSVTNIIRNFAPANYLMKSSEVQYQKKEKYYE